MKEVLILFIIFCSLLCCTYLFAQQSEIVYDNNSQIEILTGADVCADIVTVNGSFSGSGTICSGALPVTLSLFNASNEKIMLSFTGKQKMSLIIPVSRCKEELKAMTG